MRRSLDPSFVDDMLAFGLEAPWTSGWPLCRVHQQRDHVDARGPDNQVIGLPVSLACYSTVVHCMMLPWGMMLVAMDKDDLGEPLLHSMDDS